MKANRAYERGRPQIPNQESHDSSMYKNPAMETKNQLTEVKKKSERVSQVTCSYRFSVDATLKAYHSAFLHTV